MTSVPPTGRRGIARLLGRRAGWSLVDQLLSSFSNLLLSVLVARAVTGTGYGAFALCFSLYAYALTVSRLLVSQPLTIRFSGHKGPDFAVAARESTGAALVVGVAGGVGIVAAGLLTGGTLGPSLISIGVLLPGLLLQDAFRLLFFAAQRPAAAAANDFGWGVVQVAAVLAVQAAGFGGPVEYLWAWGLSGCVAGVLGAVVAGIRPAPRRTWRWLRAHSTLTRYTFTESVLLNGSNQLTLVLIAATGGLTVVGALRGAAVLAAPTTVLGLAVTTFSLPELARRPSLTGRPLIRTGLLISMVATAITGMWGVILLLLLPNGAGRLLLGQTWDEAHSILLPTVIGMVLGMSDIGAAVGVYARAGVRILFPLSIAGAAVYLVAGLVGAERAGAYGAAWGLAIAAAYGSVVYWIRFIIVARRPGTQGQDPGPAGVSGALVTEPPLASTS